MKFLDTNVLLYAIDGSEAERSKSKVARSILEQRDLALSVQVLQEFYVQATRPSRPDALPHLQAKKFVDAFSRFHVQSLTLPLVQAAMQTHDRFQISYWDAAIIEGARLSKCHTVLSEDLNDGQDYGGVRVLNPFAA